MGVCKHGNPPLVVMYEARQRRVRPACLLIGQTATLRIIHKKRRHRRRLRSGKHQCRHEHHSTARFTRPCVVFSSWLPRASHHKENQQQHTHGQLHKRVDMPQHTRERVATHNFIMIYPLACPSLTKITPEALLRVDPTTRSTKHHNG